jgi:hypothetical protein
VGHALPVDPIHPKGQAGLVEESRAGYPHLESGVQTAPADAEANYYRQLASPVAMAA